MPEVLDAARGRAQFLTLGVDLNDRSGKRKMDMQARGTHAELVDAVERCARVAPPQSGRPARVGVGYRVLLR